MPDPPNFQSQSLSKRQTSPKPDPNLSLGKCYFSASKLAGSNFIPCGNTAFGHYTCCQAGDNCLSSNACFSPQHGITYLASCTDPTYADPSCPDKGPLHNQQWSGLVQCDPKAGTWTDCKERPGAVLVEDANPTCTCKGREPLFTAAAYLPPIAKLPGAIGGTIDWFKGHEPGTGLVPTPTATSIRPTTTSQTTSETTQTGGSSISTTSSPTSTNAAASESTTTTPASSVPSSPASANGDTASGSLSNASRIGIGVGTGVGALLLIGLIMFILVCVRRRKRRAYLDDYDEKTNASKTYGEILLGNAGLSAVPVPGRDLRRKPTDDRFGAGQIQTASKVQNTAASSSPTSPTIGRGLGIGGRNYTQRGNSGPISQQQPGLAQMYRPGRQRPATNTSGSPATGLAATQPPGRVIGQPIYRGGAQAQTGSPIAMASGPGLRVVNPDTPSSSKSGLSYRERIERQRQDILSRGQFEEYHSRSDVTGGGR